MKWLKRIIANVRWRYRMYCYAEYLVRLHDKLPVVEAYRDSCVPPKSLRGVPDKELAEAWLSLTVERQRKEWARMAKVYAGLNWCCTRCSYENNGPICTHCGQVPMKHYTQVLGLPTKVVTYELDEPRSTVCDYGCDCLPGLCCKPRKPRVGGNVGG